MPNLFKILLVLAICCNPSNLFSHGGELNSEGCHNKKKTSYYHCHRKKQKIFMLLQTKVKLILKNILKI